MTQTTVVGEVASDYAAKHPHTPSLQLARMLHRDHPALFPTTECARSAVRYWRGRAGEHNKGKTAKAGRRIVYVPIPEAEEVPFGVFDLARAYPDIKRWLILADLHVPYHDPEAVETTLAWAGCRETRCDGVLYLGDLGDCYSLSSWLRDPRRRQFSDELKVTGQLLDHIQQRLKPKATVWKLGNHEYRLERYLMRCAAELFGMEEFSFKTFLDLDRRGIRLVDSMWPIKYRALTMLHGHEMRGGWTSPVNPARTAYLRMHDCTIVAHWHRTSEHTEPCAGSDRTVTCWSVGCLCNLHPEYAPLNLWNHGFSVLDVRGDWTVENHRIVKGSVK